MPSNSSTPPSLFRALVAAACAAFLALWFVGLQPLRSATYWWYVAVGDLISMWQHIPDEQLFLFTVAHDHGWVYDSWLGAVVLDSLHRLGGPGLNLLVRNIALALSVGFIAYFVVRRCRLQLAAVIPTLSAFVLLSFFVEVGPAALTLPLVVVTVLSAFFVLEAPDARRSWWAAAIPAGVFAVVNIDFASGLALVVVGLVTSALLASRLRTSEATRSTVVATTLSAASPLGLLGFAYGPDYWFDAIDIAFSLPTGLTVSGAVVAVAAGLLLGLFNISSDDAPIWPTAFSVLLVATTALLAIVAPSTIAIFVTVLAVVGADRLATLSSTSESGRPSTPRLVAGTLIVATAAILLQPGVPTRTPVATALHDDVRQTPPHAGIVTTDLPIRCVEQLREAGSRARIFHDIDDAGFLLVHLLDSQRPRAMLFDDHRDLVDDELRDRADVFRDHRGIRGFFADQAIEAAVLDRRQWPEATTELDEAPGWHDLRTGRDEWYACYVPTGHRPDSGPSIDP